MFADLHSRSHSYERLLGTFKLLLPGAEVELSGPRDAFGWRAQLAAADGFSWWHVETEFDWTCRLPEKQERFCLVLPFSGAMGARIRGKSVLADHRFGLAMSVPEIPRMGAYSANGLHGRTSLKFDPSEVNDVLGSIIEGATLKNIELEPLLDLSSAAGATLRELVNAASIAMRDEAMRSGRAMPLLREAILRLIFENFPHRFSERLDREPVAAPQQIRAAIDFMHAQMHEPLTVRDIARSVSISQRSLQLGFRRFQGTTPIAYLRDIRLRQAYAELSLPQNRLPVNEVALKWGFTHMGRFAARYRSVYGILPSETARKARGDGSCNVSIDRVMQSPFSSRRARA
jgi:AraC-like DNA-binding protein